MRGILNGCKHPASRRTKASMIRCASSCTPLRYKRTAKDFEMRFGLNPCNWAVVENLWQGLINIKPQDVIDDTVKSGFKALDLGDLGFFPPERAHEMFKSNDIEIMGAFVEVEISKDEIPLECLRKFDGTAEVLSQFKDQIHPFRPHCVLADPPSSPVRQYNSGRIKPEHMMTDREWANALRHMDWLRERALEKFGVECYLHPHAGTRIETIEEIDITLEGCSIPIVYDTGHLVYAEQGNCDLIELLDRWKNRIGTMHLKDIDAAVMAVSEQNNWRYFDCVKNDIVPNIGRGCIDFRSILYWLKDNGYKGFVCIEQETFDPSHACEDALVNREMVKKLLLDPPAIVESDWGFFEGQPRGQVIRHLERRSSHRKVFLVDAPRGHVPGTGMHEDEQIIEMPA